jgi:hypothetical protein
MQTDAVTGFLFLHYFHQHSCNFLMKYLSGILLQKEVGGGAE